MSRRCGEVTACWWCCERHVRGTGSVGERGLVGAARGTFGTPSAVRGAFAAPVDAVLVRARGRVEVAALVGQAGGGPVGGGQELREALAELLVALGVGVEGLLQCVRGTLVLLEVVPLDGQPAEPLPVRIPVGGARLPAG